MRVEFAFEKSKPQAGRVPLPGAALSLKGQRHAELAHAFALTVKRRSTMRPDGVLARHNLDFDFNLARDQRVGGSNSL